MGLLVSCQTRQKHGGGSSSRDEHVMRYTRSVHRPRPSVVSAKLMSVMTDWPRAARAQVHPITASLVSTPAAFAFAH